MPYFVYPITVPKNTLESKAITDLLGLHRGIVHHLEVWFSPGCQGNVGVKLFRRESQVFPFNADGWAKGDASSVGGAREWLEWESPPYEMRYRAYNLDENVDREFLVIVGILPREILEPVTRLTDVIVAFLRRLRIPLPWVS